MIMRAAALFALLWFAGLNLMAQSFRFENITVDQGLSQSQVLELFQDVNGEIWMGTANGGISIFDGYSFRYVTQQDGLPSNTIYDIEYLNDSELAIATFEGFAILNIHTLSIKKVTSSHPSDVFYKIFRKANGDYLLGTAKGLALLQGENIVSAQVAELENIPVFNIQKDANGAMWYSTLGHGVFRESSGAMLHLENSSGLPSNNVNGIFEFRGSLFVLTYRGASQFLNGRLVEPEATSGLSNDIVIDAITDSRGEAWLGTLRGLGHINGEYFAYTPADGIVGRQIGKIIEDKEGNIWCASRESGVTRIRERVFTTLHRNHLLGSDGVNRMVLSPDGDVWVCTDDGITVFGKDSSIQRYGKESGLPNAQIRTVYFDQGETWVGSSYGLYFLRNKRFIKAEVGKGSSIFIQDICRFRDTLFVATVDGLCYVHRRELRRYILPDLPEAALNQLLVDHQNRLWIGTNEKGLYQYDGERLLRFAEVEGFTAKTVKNLYLDSSNRLWVAANNGLFVYDGGVFHRFGTKDGLGSDAVVSITQVNDTVFWAGLGKGANRFVYTGSSISQVKMYGPEHGFTGQESNPRAIMVKDGQEVWFGTNQGLNIYHPDHDRLNDRPPVTRISALRLFMQDTDWREYTEELDNSGLPIQLVLPYNKNNISFNFKAVTHVSPELVRYRYRLAGEDSEWIETSERKADYSNLSHGKYRFEVMACNSDGVWTTSASGFGFEIRPPFWRTWWFYMLIVTIIAAGFYSYFKIRTSNRKITQINTILSEQKDIISQKNKDIMDSIRYAKRILDAVLPAPEHIDLPKTFVFFRPRDVVSGDFYWFWNKGDISLFAVADCTGHGVPGAFMSIIGYNLMDKIVGEHHIYEPAAILNKLNNEISKTLNRKMDTQSPVRDGLDIAVCCFHRDSDEIEYAGAVHPFVLWRKGELSTIKGDRMSIGSASNGFRYTNHRIKLEKGDGIYLFTDGFVDQFGGEKGKKYKSAHFRELLLRMGKYPIDQQRNMMIREFENWKGGRDQVDDVLVLGTLL